GLVRFFEAFFAEEFVNGVGVNAGEEFAFGIGPGVFGGAGDVDGARGSEGDEEMGIDREAVHVFVVLFEVAVEPVGEAGVDAFDGFANVAAGEGGAAFAGIVGDDDGETFVLGAGPQGRFAQA